ncbi:MAG: hypothetical protein AUJ52_05875 [Elusimicrobia bacterium CG1_02_63_36]|nr:MAG: hypothetical protein AUJ52_05875 [Elusimicrobia bacterium CG1_02_63_36]PIP84937.1 MAG: hypothetical protein COR54_01550 [Elusimicrobia bacterium CG22_combo_CG10-13_8_21_14_all_63_91]PJA13292.1 MAG: hypothetical protein COX66_15140 [Elusimicrobia bacterium CG_4_10_14_0_2_um_filter_63_34]PJB26124.1 MAG: hypothetical protein CO113_05120 [Elusimicrobia bacterium CG_4_9_14_3_um_filter_62_55]
MSNQAYFGPLQRAAALKRELRRIDFKRLRRLREGVWRYRWGKTNACGYHILLDLSGAGKHFCTCADLSIQQVPAGMICPHILGALQKGGHNHLLLEWMVS